MIMGKSFTRLLQAYCRNVSLLEFSSSWWLQRRAKWESWLLVWKRVKNDPMVLNLCLSHILVQEQRSNNTNNVAAASGAVYVYMYMYIYLYFIYIYYFYVHIYVYICTTHIIVYKLYMYIWIYIIIMLVCPKTWDSPDLQFSWGHDDQSWDSGVSLYICR
jgi:hypothetical protein